jgi:Zn finger protein HypA/HybF involved in hydrogenase expression
MMYEAFDTEEFIRTIEDVVNRQNGARVDALEFEIGCYAPLTAGGFCEEFTQLTRGTAADGARIRAVQAQDNSVAWASEIMLQSVILSIPCRGPQPR